MSAFNAHLIQSRVHLSNDPNNTVEADPATDLPTGIVLANTLKSSFNTHRTAIVDDSDAPAHVSNDTVNIVSTPNAFDANSLVILADAINNAYNAHLTQLGVHANSIFIHLAPPAQVLYEGTEFFQINTGTAGQVAPFSDDETLYLSGFQFQANQSLSYEGGSFPEQVNLVGANPQPFNIIDGDSLSVAIDANPSILIKFQAGDINAAAVVSRINGTAGIPVNFAQDNGDGRIRLTSPTVGPASAIFTSGIAATKLGLNVAQFTPWTQISGNPAAVSLQLLTVGVTDFLRYSTIGPGTNTAYVSPSGLPDVTSLDFEMTTSLRINTFVLTPNGDTGIYVGISGRGGNGFTAAIGFEVENDLNFVKIQDINANVCLYRCAFNWNDGNFHTYKLSRKVSTNSMSLTIVS